MPAASKLLDKISAEFPHLKWTDYIYIDEGWDHEVIVLDDKIVFRFPSDTEYTKKLKYEIEVLKFIQPKLNVKIPQYNYISTDHTFAGYTIITGQQIFKPRFDNLTIAQRTSIARQLADFLSIIHSQPTDSGVLANLNKSYLGADQANIKASLPKLKLKLDSQEYTIALNILSEIYRLLQKKLPAKFIHNDIYSRHLIWNANNNALGLIDFSDMCLGDPAVDFAELHEYGKDFVEEVYKLYTGTKDATFLDRAWQYQRWIGVDMMTDYFESQKTTFEVAKQTFDRAKQQVI